MSMPVMDLISSVTDENGFAVGVRWSIGEIDFRLRSGQWARGTRDTARGIDPGRHRQRVGQRSCRASGVVSRQGGQHGGTRGNRRAGVKCSLLGQPKPSEVAFVDLHQPVIARSICVLMDAQRIEPALVLSYANDGSRCHDVLA